MYTLCFHLYIYLFYWQNVSILNKSKNSITHNFQPETNQDISLIPLWRKKGCGVWWLSRDENPNWGLHLRYLEENWFLRLRCWYISQNRQIVGISNHGRHAVFVNMVLLTGCKIFTRDSQTREASCLNKLWKTATRGDFSWAIYFSKARKCKYYNSACLVSSSLSPFTWHKQLHFLTIACLVATTISGASQ